LRTAKLVGIKEEELYSFIDVLPAMWNKASGVFDPSMSLILRRHHESETSVFRVYLYDMSQYLLALIVEYQRESGLATIEVSVIYGGGSYFGYEERIRNILLDVTEKDLEALTSFEKRFPKGMFICPSCGAQYVQRVLRINEEGETECQNCGHFVRPST
jgi:predicted RNA-binding Zn-ribbon protein involved in translation (DUF1610 family)